MTAHNTPRVRTLLRQAERTADSGKRAAAEQLYRQIIEESPEVPEAWVGLAGVLYDEAEREEAYQNALTLDPKNETAQLGLARLRGEIAPEAEEVFEIEEKTIETPEPESEHEVIVTGAASYDLVCYRHPDRETSLRCNKCGKPICIKCAQKTAVGYRCTECIREIEAGFFTATTQDYVLVPAVLLPLSLIIGVLVIRFASGGFFLIFLMLFVGGAIGRWLGRIAFRVAGRRRGRYLPYIVAACVALGVLLPAGVLFLLLGAFPGLLGPGIYLFVATSAAFYASR